MLLTHHLEDALAEHQGGEAGVEGGREDVVLAEDDVVGLEGEGGVDRRLGPQVHPAGPVTEELADRALVDRRLLAELGEPRVRVLHEDPTVGGHHVALDVVELLEAIGL